MIYHKDSLEFLKEQKNHIFDINYSDPPYALGSEIYIRPDGKLDYKKATDFMNKWKMPTGEYWEEWFEESFRTLKHGGYCIMFGIDRQLPLFQYYAIKAGFQVRQSLYWYFISSFPKVSDLSKNLDKNAKAIRTEVIGKGKAGKGMNKVKGFGMNTALSDDYTKEWDITLPQTELAKKYDGYKYSIAPLKQTCETIMIFQKPYKTGSCLHDTLAYENGDETCACFALNINASRVDFISSNDEKESKTKNQHKDFGTQPMLNNNVYGDFSMIEKNNYNPSGRYPSQTFCDTDVAAKLDEQSGISKGSDAIRVRTKTSDSFGMPNNATPEYDDVGGCSKILHKCDYQKEEVDLYFYAPKVSKSERNAGCEELDDQHFSMRPFAEQGADKSVMKNRLNSKEGKNNHPTLKPISLSFRILTLFKTPNPQKIAYTFAGVQSEVIGGFKAGFTDFSGCELNAEYVDIGNVRFEHWKDKPFDNSGKLLTVKKEKKKPNVQLKLL